MTTASTTHKPITDHGIQRPANRPAGAFPDGAALTAITGLLHTGYIACLTPASYRANLRRLLVRRSSRFAEPLTGSRGGRGGLGTVRGRRGAAGVGRVVTACGEHRQSGIGPVGDRRIGTTARTRRSQRERSRGTPRRPPSPPCWRPRCGRGTGTQARPGAFMGPTVAALCSCATRWGWGRAHRGVLLGARPLVLRRAAGAGVGDRVMPRR